MKLIFFGLGSIGKRHLSLLPSAVTEVYAFRSGRSQEPTPTGVQEIKSWEKIQALKPDVAFICNPTSLHIETAFKCAELGMALFIEKPIGHDLKDLDSLVEIVQRKKIVSYVAYPLRFHPVIEEARRWWQNSKAPSTHVRASVASYLPDWRPGTDHLLSYSANRNLGGGVLLDLSHELDYLTHLFGQPKRISGVSGKLMNVTKDTEDYADLSYEVGTVKVQLHLDYFSHVSERRFVIDIPGQTAVGDLLTGDFLIQDATGKKELKKTISRDQLFKNQLDYFFSMLGKNTGAVMNNLSEASELFRVLMQFKKEKGL